MLTQVTVTLWWLFFWTALGLCLGSFLNAVIYRLPRNRSLRDPLWSACPYCRHRIRWYDNLPILSFLLLRGRCRDCGVPIATRYLVVEATMAIVVLMLLDAFFIGQARAGLSDSAFGLTDHLSYDWPPFLAHVILFACLLPMAVIDIEYYWVDVRFTNLATVAGFVLHTLWTPKHSSEWFRPWDSTSVVSLFAIVALGIVWLVFACQPQAEADDTDGSATAEPPPLPAASAPARRPPPSLASPSRLSGWVASFLLVGLLFALVLDETGAIPLHHAGRTLVPLVFLFVLVVAVSTTQRESDREIAEAIHEERHQARGMVLSEFALLVPAVIAGALGLWIMSGEGELPRRIGEALHAPVRVPGIHMMRNWAPLYGLATAATGYVVAGAVGWSVRIVFTLLFGKEAFGAGDIHLMAATGCVAGWPVVVLGFFLTSVLAMIGWVLALPFKRTRALPLGPWLSLSFLAIVVFYGPILSSPPIARTIETFRMLFLENSQALSFGGVP